MKPNNIKPEHLNLEKREGDMPEDIKKKIQAKLFDTPNQKYKWPMTHAQEIGWDGAEGLNTNPRMPKGTCDVTRYANDYAKLNNGRSPYATKEISNSKGGEEKK